MQTIGFLGDCQADAWAESFRLALPEDRVWSISLPDTSNGDPWARALSVVGEVDHLFVVDSFRSQFDGHTEVVQSCPIEPRFVPSITFSAFHPDITFAQVGGATVHGGQGAAWLSRIALWSFLEGLPADDAVRLFRRQVFEDLGYLDQYPISEEACRRQYEPLGFSISRWLAECELLGPFMHGSNHPIAAAVCLLAQQLLDDFGGSSTPRRCRPEDALRYMTDYQATSVWPIYPPIAQRYGYRGGYLFKHHGDFRYLDSHVRLSYARWHEAGVTPESIRLVPDHPPGFIDVLREHAGSRG